MPPQYQDKYTFSWKFWLWLIAALTVVLIVATLSTAWLFRKAQEENLSLSGISFSQLVIDFPRFFDKAVQELRSNISGDPLSQLIDRKLNEKPNWIRSFPAPADTGYLLLSGIDPEAKRSVVQLIRISDGKRLALWQPDWSAILDKGANLHFAFLRSFSALRTMHPLLLDDGDIIFNSNDVALIRLSPCSTKPVWVLNELMHHSNEIDENGLLWTPSFVHDGYSENPWLQERLSDDALAHVTTDGVVLEKRSFARILRNNGLEAMLMGMFGSSLKTDPLHLNQIQVALRDSRYWKRGDLLISARHLSTVFLYRPSSDKIIWYQTGPWMNQHSVDFVDDHRISMFDNHVVSGAPAEHSFMLPSDTNRVYVYDFETKQVSQPFKTLLAQARPISNSEGRARVLPDGGLFLEETNYGRDMRFTKDKLLWSRVNDYDKERIGMVSWSRYLTAEEASVPLKALTSRQCPE